MEGKVVNGYSLVGELGRGTYAKVYRAQKDGIDYAIKKFFFLYSSIPDDCKQEAKILKGLNHKNVIKYVEDFVIKDIFYIVTEYAPNGTLQELIEDD